VNDGKNQFGCELNSMKQFIWINHLEIKQVNI